MINKNLVCIFIFFFCLDTIKSQTNLNQQSWVDSIYSGMSLDQKIGQLFMVRAFSKFDTDEVNKILSYIDTFHIGGMCFFQGSPIRQVELTNLYQEKSKTPLFIGIDGEWGLGMRFPESVMKFPKQLTLGAIEDDSLIYKMGSLVAKQCKKMGIQFNFAPVVDINSNAGNPVINERAFGEDKYYVTNKAIAYMKGLQDNSMIATAKHFPGHGDTNVDSHMELPVINRTIDQLHNVELYPFKALIKEGVSSIMVGHLQIPSLDDRPFRSASLSYNIVTELLRVQLGFDGLIITDAMEMKGITRHYANGQAEVEAFLAGCDVILMPDNLAAAITMLKSYILEGKITFSRLEESVKRILSAKYKAQLYNRKPLDTKNLLAYLNSNENIALKTTLMESALTLAIDANNALPFENFHTKKMMTVGIGLTPINTFHKRLNDYHTFTHYTIKKEIPLTERREIMEEAENFDFAIVSLHEMSRFPGKEYGITKESIGFIKELATKTKVILVIFGNPYALKYFETIPTILVAYEEDDLVQDITAQAMFGVSSFNGRLPITASSFFPLSGGLSKNKLDVLGYSVPERVGLNTEKLNEIDDIAYELIRKKAAPGCVILLAKDNRIIYHKAFGNHMYDGKTAMQKDDVFDVASLTKVLATTLAIMKLYDEKLIEIASPISKYIPQLMHTDKKDITIVDAMSHYARLLPYIPFYKSTIGYQNKKVVLPIKYYHTKSSAGFDVKVASKIFLRSNYVDTIWEKVFTSSLLKRDGYKYSDLGFYLMKKVIENTSRQKLDDYANKNFYKPLGLLKTMFNPLDKIPKEQLVPTEKDEYWRGQLIQGTVHDMGAAMLGGVGGHAGLFSNTKEIAILMQVLLNKGIYGGLRFFEESTVGLFTTRYKNSTRRGLGFDLKEKGMFETINMGNLAGDNTFGHTGFTGTCAYADPTNNIIYVFLSNRTFPSMNNNLLNKNDYRSKIQNLIYKAMETNK